MVTNSLAQPCAKCGLFKIRRPYSRLVELINIVGKRLGITSSQALEQGPNFERS